MINIFEKPFEKLDNKIKSNYKSIVEKFRAYFKKLLFPLYLFPIKLLTYSTYYLIRLIIKFIFTFLSLIFETIIYPFRSLKNFLKAIFIFCVFGYLVASLFVIADYLRNQYGGASRITCAFRYSVNKKLQASVVRVVGGYSEGSGFFIEENKVLTNFHVIDGEPSPKIIFPDGKFITPEKILGNKSIDLAVLLTKDKYSDIVMLLPDEIGFYENETLVSAGYPLGTDLTGKATVLKGSFVEFRKSKKDPLPYIQTSINLTPGMSGGPLVDQCGNVVGINTLGLSGLSLFIAGDWAKDEIPNFTDQEIKKVNVDPSKSPEDAVYAFYTYLKARRMEDGFELLSTEYLQKTNFKEWTNRFTDILDVDVIKSEKFENSKDTAFVKFSTKNWVEGEAEIHFYEGTWQTVLEDGVYKMRKSKILEVENPGWDWFYE